MSQNQGSWILDRESKMLAPESCIQDPATKPPEPTRLTEPTARANWAACASPAGRGDFADQNIQGGASM
jgi:hypothetical protein